VLGWTDQLRLLGFLRSSHSRNSANFAITEFYEVRLDSYSELVKRSLRIVTHIPKFIGDSSPAGNKAGVRHDVAQSNTKASILCRNNPPKTIAWG
jgi:hypothetical protein